MSIKFCFFMIIFLIYQKLELKYFKEFSEKWTQVRKKSAFKILFPQIPKNKKSRRVSNVFRT